MPDLVIVLLFVCLALLPFLPGALVLRRRADATPLDIPVDDARHPRELGLNWRELHGVEEGAEAVDTGRAVATLTRPAGTALTPAGEELYLTRGGALERGGHARVVVADAQLSLGEESVIERFVDAEGDLTVGPRAVLGQSASSAGTLLLGAGVRFRRLYGQPVRVAGHFADTLTGGVHLGSELIWARDALRLPDGLDLKSDVVTYGDVYLGAGTRVRGHVKAHGSIHLYQGARVDGNLVARRDIVLHGQNEVGGGVQAEGGVSVGPEVRIGGPGQGVTVYAVHHVWLAPTAEIWGRVVAESGGVAERNESDLKRPVTAVAGRV